MANKLPNNFNLQDMTSKEELKKLKNNPTPPKYDIVDISDSKEVSPASKAKPKQESVVSLKPRTYRLPENLIKEIDKLYGIKHAIDSGFNREDIIIDALKQYLNKKENKDLIAKFNEILK